MKVLLINPPRENEIIGNNPPIIEKERGFNPPLGLLYLAAYLEKHSKHDVNVLDTQVENVDYNTLASRIRSVKPDIVGVTAMTLKAAFSMPRRGITVGSCSPGRPLKSGSSISCGRSNSNRMRATACSAWATVMPATPVRCITSGGFSRLRSSNGPARTPWPSRWKRVLVV